MTAASLPPSLRAPERWRVDAGDSDVAVLHVPPVTGHTRRIEVDVSFVVRTPTEADAPWHELSVEIDGKRHWSRRIGSSNPGADDSLEYHATVEVAAAAALRVRALTKVRGAVRARLLLEAAEAA